MPQKGFFGSLFDFSFSSFVTTKIVKFLYVLATVILLGSSRSPSSSSRSRRAPPSGCSCSSSSPRSAFLFYVIYTRVLLELFIAIFRIMETQLRTGRARTSRASRAATSASSPPPSAPA